jgi:hypothetical protein
MKIKLPPGFEPPNGTQPGQAFDAIAKLRQCEDGRYELLAVDGAPLSDAKDDSDDDEPLSDSWRPGMRGPAMMN